jgi:hypothetical protein
VDWWERGTRVDHVCHDGLERTPVRAAMAPVSRRFEEKQSRGWRQTQMLLGIGENVGLEANTDNTDVKTD